MQLLLLLLRTFTFDRSRYAKRVWQRAPGHGSSFIVAEERWKTANELRLKVVVPFIKLFRPVSATNSLSNEINFVARGCNEEERARMVGGCFRSRGEIRTERKGRKKGTRGTRHLLNCAIHETRSFALFDHACSRDDARESRRIRADK